MPLCFRFAEPRQGNHQILGDALPLRIGNTNIVHPERVILLSREAIITQGFRDVPVDTKPVLIGPCQIDRGVGIAEIMALTEPF